MDDQQKTRPIRVTEEAIRWARIASGYTGESMSEYVCRVVIERGKQDADELHAVVSKAAKGAASKRQKGGD